MYLKHLFFILESNVFSTEGVVLTVSNLRRKLECSDLVFLWNLLAGLISFPLLVLWLMLSYYIYA